MATKRGEWTQIIVIYLVKRLQSLVCRGSVKCELLDMGQSILRDREAPIVPLWLRDDEIGIESARSMRLRVYHTLGLDEARTKAYMCENTRQT